LLDGIQLAIGLHPWFLKAAAVRLKWGRFRGAKAALFDGGIEDGDDYGLS